MTVHVGIRGPGHLSRTGSSGGAPAPPSTPITELEVLGPAAVVDPVGAGPYDYETNGALLRLRMPCTVANRLSALVPGEIHVHIETSGYTNNNGAGPISLTTRTFDVNPTAILRRQADAVSGASNITNTTQVIRQGGSLVTTPTLGVSTDYLLVLPMHVYQGDTVTVTVDDGWDGPGSLSGTGPAVTNNSTVTTATHGNPIYGWFNAPYDHVTTSTYNVELQVAGHRYGWMGGAENVQMVAGVDIWATDGTNSGPVTQVTSVALSDIQTVNAKAEVFKAAVDLTGVNETDGTTTSGPGRAYLDAIIYPWRGASYRISTDGAAWPTAQPCTIHPFVKDVDGKFAGATWAPVRSDGLLTTAVTTGILTSYPGGQPTAAASYSNIIVAAAALATWFNQTGGRPAGAVTHNNPAGGTILLVNTTGAAQGYEMATAGYSPTATASTYTKIESWTGNAFECFYNAANDRTWSGGMVRSRVRLHKNGGSFRCGNTSANSFNSALVWENTSWTWGTSTISPPIQRCALNYYFNMTAVAPQISGAPGAGGFGQETDSPYRAAKIIGFSFGDDANSPAELRPYHVVGLVGRISSAANPTAARQSTNDGFIVYNCHFAAFTGSLFDFNQNTDGWPITRGAIVWQSIFEGIAAGGCNVGFQIGSTSQSVRNVMWGFNTGAYDPADDATTLQNDDRNGFSLFYRDANNCFGTTADGVVAGNLTPRIAFKGDYFTAINAGLPVGNIGAFGVSWGRDCHANAMLISRTLNNINDAATFGWRANDAATQRNLGLVSWVDNRCIPGSPGAGIGFGNYRLQTAALGGNNVGKGIIPAGRAWNRYCHGGVLRKNAASGATATTGATGAFEATD